MIGLATYLISSPRRIMALLGISAAVVAASQFSPLFNGDSGIPGAGAVLPVTESITLDSPHLASLFNAEREIPVDPVRAARESASQPSGTPVTGANGVQGQPVDEPRTGGNTAAVNEIPVVAPVPDSGVGGEGGVENLVLRPTFAWVNVFSESSTLDGKPVTPGDIVTAFDPEGTLTGRFTVKTEGKFGMMALYMDDPETAVDEGAEPGDTLTFRINGVTATPLGPHEPVWTRNGAVIISNLAAVTGAELASAR